MSGIYVRGFFSRFFGNLNNSIVSEVSGIWMFYFIDFHVTRGNFESVGWARKFV